MQLTAMGVLAAIDAPPGMGGRLSLPLGATPALFVRMLGSQVFLNAIVGSNHLATRLQPEYFALSALLAIGGCAILVYTLAKAPLEIKLFVLFSLLVFGTQLEKSVNALECAAVAHSGWRIGVPVLFLPDACLWLVSNLVRDLEQPNLSENIRGHSSGHLMPETAENLAISPGYRSARRGVLSAVRCCQAGDGTANSGLSWRRLGYLSQKALIRQARRLYPDELRTGVTLGGFPV